MTYYGLHVSHGTGLAMPEQANVGDPGVTGHAQLKEMSMAQMSVQGVTDAAMTPELSHLQRLSHMDVKNKQS